MNPTAVVLKQPDAEAGGVEAGLCGQNETIFGKENPEVPEVIILLSPGELCAPVAIPSDTADGQDYR